MTVSSVLIALATAAALTTAPEASGLALKDLPPAVRRAVQAEVKGSTIRTISSEKKDGATFYEVETNRNGRQRDLLFAQDGTLSETEELLSVSEWPRPVVESTRKEGRIKQVERLTHGSDISYEVTIARNGHQREIQVRGDGTIVGGK